MPSESEQERRPRRRQQQLIKSSVYRIIPSTIIFFAVGLLCIIVTPPSLLVQDVTSFVVVVDAWTANNQNQVRLSRCVSNRSSSSLSLSPLSSPLLMATMFPSTSEKKKNFPSSSSDKKNIDETMTMRSNNKSPASVLFTAVVAATFFACSTTVLPAVAAANDNNNNNNAFGIDSPNPITAITRSVSSSSSPSSTTVSSLESLNSNSNSMEQDLIKTLKAPTEDQPQIPFPGTTKREAATSTAATSTTKQKQPKKKIATASENQQFILPAQLSIELSSSSPSPERPYNGADVLVLQVWTDRPSSDLSSSVPSVASADASPKIIGGAQIPIGAIGGSFPVRFSLGPLNSVVGKEEEWKSLSSSNDLWLRASICRDNSDNSETINTSAASSSSLAPCPTSGTIILEGIGFSKWINFNNIQQQQQDGGSSADSSGNDKGGIRAPATVVLTTKATATGAASSTK
jgi:hypothetical protein